MDAFTKEHQLRDCVRRTSACTNSGKTCRRAKPNWNPSSLVLTVCHIILCNPVVQPWCADLQLQIWVFWLPGESRKPNVSGIKQLSWTNTQVSYIIRDVSDPSQGHLRWWSKQNTLLMMWMFFRFSIHKLQPPPLSPLSPSVHLHLIHPNYADSISSEEKLCLTGCFLFSYLDQTLKRPLSCWAVELVYRPLYHMGLKCLCARCKDVCGNNWNK